MVSQMINAHEVEDLLRQMEVLSRRLHEYTKSANGGAPGGGDPNSTSAVLGLVQQLLERLVGLQGLLFQNLVAEMPAKRRPGRPKGAKNKPKPPQDATGTEATAPVPTAPEGLDGEWIGDFFIPKLTSAHGKVPCVPGGKVCP
jgi:hypothetical protein